MKVCQDAGDIKMPSRQRKHAMSQNTLAAWLYHVKTDDTQSLPTMIRIVYSVPSDFIDFFSSTLDFGASEARLGIWVLFHAVDSLVVGLICGNPVLNQPGFLVPHCHAVAIL